MTNQPNNKGRHATKPRRIPWKGLKEVALRVKEQLKKDHIQVISAGVAFYFFLAIFPAIAALISVYGIITDPVQVQQQMTQAAAFLPEEAYNLLSDTLNRITSKSSGTLGWSLVFSILLSLWSANKGTSALFEGINVAYDELDERGLIKKYALTLLFTFIGIVVGIIALAIVVGYPALVGSLNLPEPWHTIIELVRWLLLAGLIIVVLTMIYKFAPDRDNPEFRWASWGSVVATVLWLLGSLLFTLYVNQFGNFDATYGSVAAVIILMLWFFLTAFIILLGAEINSELEHQTAYDSTTGPDEPMGQRGAWHADHVADSE